MQKRVSIKYPIFWIHTPYQHDQRKCNIEQPGQYNNKWLGPTATICVKPVVSVQQGHQPPPYAQQCRNNSNKFVINHHVSEAQQPVYKSVPVPPFQAEWTDMPCRQIDQPWTLTTQQPILVDLSHRTFEVSSTRNTKTPSVWKRGGEYPRDKLGRGLVARPIWDEVARRWVVWWRLASPVRSTCWTNRDTRYKTVCCWI